MGKEFRNIDEMYRSELGGAVTEAPASVKGNIDSALGFKKRKAGYLLLSLIVLLTTVGITTAVLTNMNGANQVAQSDITESELNETVNNTLNPSYNANNRGALENESENGANATNRIDNASLADGNSDGANNNAVNENATNANSTTRNNLAQSGSTNLNSGQGRLTAASTIGVNPNPNQPNVSFNGTESNGQTGTNDNSSVSDNGITKGQDKVNTNTSNNNIGDNNSSQGNLNSSSVDDNLAKAEGNAINDSNIQTSSNSADGNVVTSGTVDPKDSDPTNNDPNQAKGEPSANIITDNGASNDGNTESDTTIADSNSSDSTLTEPPTENLVTINPPPKDLVKPLMLSLTSGINLLRSNYTSDNMSEETLYDNALSDNIGNQTNLDITYRLKNGLTFGTGLGLNNYNESYEFTTYQSFIDTTEIFETIIFEYEYDYGIYYSVDTSGTIVDSIPFIQDSTGYAIDTVYTYAYDENQKGTKHNGVNKATYFTLPVHLGTQIIMNKFQLDLYASARFNFLMRSSGGYFGDNEVSLFGNENSIYKSFYVDVLFASKVHYNFYKNLYLTGTVQYRPVMGNSFKEVSFNKTFDYMHFGLGLSLRL